MTPADTLFLPLDVPERAIDVLSIGARAAVLTGFARERAPALFADMLEIAAISPFRRMVTPGGRGMSIAVTNSGDLGWVSDRTGYRFDPADPLTGRRWPAFPPQFHNLAVEAAAVLGFVDFTPDACLINRYTAGARLSFHQDRNELDFSQPVVTVSLGLPAMFLWGGHERGDRPARVLLTHGDVMVWGGPDRLRFHGVGPLADGWHPLTGRARYSLTFRKAA